MYCNDVVIVLDFTAHPDLKDVMCETQLMVLRRQFQIKFSYLYSSDKSTWWLS